MSKVDELADELGVEPDLVEAAILEVEADGAYRYIFIVEATEEAPYHDAGDIEIIYSENGVERAYDGLVTIERVELPRLFDDSGLARWLAESDEAFELLADSIGREAAEQIQEETRESPMYPNS